VRTVTECLERVVYWSAARQKAEDAWLGYVGAKPSKKAQLCRAYEFADCVLHGWEQQLLQAETRQHLRSRGLPLLRAL
jgi:hypothetical protein